MRAGISIFRSAAWNWAGMIFDSAAAFLVMPFLIRQLGEARYGTWVLIGSLSSYFGMLDLGVRGSVGRFIAFHRARGDRDAIKATLSTALGIASVAGIVALVVSLCLPILFFRLFEIPADQADQVRAALLLIGCNIALSFPLSLFDGILWGYERFDAINAVEVPIAVMRALLTFVVIGWGYGLAGLAALTLILLLVSGTSKAVATFRLAPGLSIRPAYLTRSAAAELVSYGASNLLINVARMIRGEVSPALIGSLVSLPSVTLYAVGKRFTDYVERLVFATTGVLTPLTASIHARGHDNRQRTLLLVGGRYCSMMAIFLCGGLILLGRPLIALWLGPRVLDAASLLTILALGELIPLSQSVSATILLGMARHRIIARFAFAEILLLGVLAAVLVRPFGLVGVVASIAVAGATCRGMALAVCACRYLEVPLGDYLRAAVWPPLSLAVAALFVSKIAIEVIEPTTWGLLLAHCVLYTAIFAACSLTVVSAEQRALVVEGVRRRFFPA